MFGLKRRAREKKRRLYELAVCRELGHRIKQEFPHFPQRPCIVCEREQGDRSCPCGEEEVYLVRLKEFVERRDAWHRAELKKAMDEYDARTE